MVGHLLKDIVESSEKPSLVCQQDPKYDRFGFKIDEEGSLEEKAERLRRVAQDNWEESELSLEEVRESNVRYQISNKPGGKYTFLYPSVCGIFLGLNGMVLNV